MKYKIRVTNTFAAEYKNVIKYFPEILKEKSAAKNLNDEFIRIVNLIESNPNLFALSKEKELKKRHYHKVNVNNYLVLYKVSKQEIFLAHIFHQSQDYAKLV